eukprot:TRINITY_DN20263_c0_g1_i4.p2 TRINITY_DN20263_c0_g1~~TRINITY_DN20263_c0_g1_i4.p2  ORF type:complete len:105 (-),score=3.25 TRINITY_DN20263_c0_g1_i4:262-576(-)
MLVIGRTEHSIHNGAKWSSIAFPHKSLDYPACSHDLVREPFKTICNEAIQAENVAATKTVAAVAHADLQGTHQVVSPPLIVRQDFIANISEGTRIAFPGLLHDY